MTEEREAARRAEIRFQVELDDDHLPIAIEWEATDSPSEAPRTTRSIMLSLWDEREKRAMCIDLWTRDMLVDDMKLFVFQNLMTMADTFERATSETELANDIRVFANQLAAKLGFVK